MATYVDGFVLTIKKDDLTKYKKMATEARDVWKKHGALDYKECVYDDMPHEIKLPFPKLIGAKEDETVVFAYVVYASKAERNKINKQVMKYFEEKYGEDMEASMPQMRRFSVGGFKTIVE